MNSYIRGHSFGFFLRFAPTARLPLCAPRPPYCKSVSSCVGVLYCTQGIILPTLAVEEGPCGLRKVDIMTRWQRMCSQIIWRAPGAHVFPTYPSGARAVRDAPPVSSCSSSTNSCEAANIIFIYLVLAPGGAVCMVFQVEQCMFQVEHVSLAKEANGFFFWYDTCQYLPT